MFVRRLKENFIIGNKSTLYATFVYFTITCNLFIHMKKIFINGILAGIILTIISYGGLYLQYNCNF